MDDTERPSAEPDSGQRRGMDGMIFDIARKAVASSVKSLLSSEEGLRALIGAIVPKEIGQYVSRELAAFRSGFLEAITGEISRFLDRIDPAAEIQKVVDGLEFDIHVKMGVSRRKPPSESPVDGSESAPPARPARKATTRKPRKPA